MTTTDPYAKEGEIITPDGRRIAVRREDQVYDDDPESPTYDEFVWVWVELGVEEDDAPSMEDPRIAILKLAISSSLLLIGSLKEHISEHRWEYWDVDGWMNDIRGIKDSV